MSVQVHAPALQLNRIHWHETNQLNRYISGSRKYKKSHHRESMQIGGVSAFQQRMQKDRQ